MDGGEALNAGCDVGEERRLRDIVQALQLTNQDSVREWVLGHSRKLAAMASSLPAHILLTWRQCVEKRRG